jgi:transcriptional regulator with XRE-family HTH domain
MVTSKSNKSARQSKTIPTIVLTSIVRQVSLVALPPTSSAPSSPVTRPLLGEVAGERRRARGGVSYLRARPSHRSIVKQAMVKKSPNPVDKHVGSRVRMRRMMLGMSQEKLGDSLGLTFQQVQKYESGKNRIGASRLQHISHILQIPVPFFFEGAPHVPGQPEGIGEAPSPAYVSEFLATTEGLALTKAFMLVKEPRLRRRIVELVKEIAGDDLS